MPSFSNAHAVADTTHIINFPGVPLTEELPRGLPGDRVHASNACVLLLSMLFMLFMLSWLPWLDIFFWLYDVCARCSSTSGIHVHGILEIRENILLVVVATTAAEPNR